MPVVRTKVVSRRVQETRPEKLIRTLPIKEFFEKRNKILIIRSVGGLGDILMHRMMFEDFKLLMPEAEIHFACPKYYHDAVVDHPFVDKLLDSNDFDKSEYIISYNTSTVCGRTEMRLAPFSGPHRSDIWAGHCGLILTKHDMHFRLTEEEKAEGKKIIEAHRDRDGKSVLLAPVSAMASKNLTEHQIAGLVKGLWDRGLYVFALHNNPIHAAIKNDIPMVSENKLRKWFGIINQADYVISVDTATFHCAGGMGKPLVGIFTWADGKVYGKYYDFFLVQRHRGDDPDWTCGPCYNWCNCPKSNKPLKPCLTEITAEMILGKVDMMLAKWPNGNCN
jgi:ADP-heptose:LPS heptosyltransferase